jgi:DNA/RNA endonuclease YhcR with UshA esterase domain
MKLQKIFFIISLFGIISLILLSQTTKGQRGTIKSIKYSENKITLRLEKRNETLIIFYTQPINLSEGDKIIFQGKSEFYKGERQIIINKLSKKT